MKNISFPRGNRMSDNAAFGSRTVASEWREKALRSASRRVYRALRERTFADRESVDSSDSCKVKRLEQIVLGFQLLTVKVIPPRQSDFSEVV